MLEIYNIEEKGDENCLTHLWNYYRLDGKDKYRECQRCWLKQKIIKEVWTEINMWH